MAARIALAPVRPAIMSAMAKAGSTGGRSSKPLEAAKPLIASIRVPKPGLCWYMPSWPQPEMRTITSLGLISWSWSGPMPIFSRVPGRKFSTRPSAVATSLVNSSLALASRRFSVRLRLLRE